MVIGKNLNEESAERKVLTAEPVPEEARSGGKGRGFLSSLFWILAAGFSLFWIFFPEPSDVIPFLGWLDEGLAGVLLVHSLGRLGIRIPFLTDFLDFKRKKDK